MKALFMVLLVISAAIAAAQSVDKAESTASHPPLVAGTWRGPWDSQGRHSGDMEVEARMVDDANLQGRVKASFFNRTNCSTGWETLTGTKNGDKFIAQYDLRGSCGKVDLVFSIQGDVMAGTWTNEHGRNGNFRLSKR